MKKIILLLAFLFCIANFQVSTDANNSFFAPVCVNVNGNYVKTNNHAYLSGDHTLVSFRDIGDIFSSSVTWHPETASAKILSGGTSITVTNGKKQALVNGKNVILKTPATIVNDRFYVPLRFLAETFGAKVTWNATTLTANIVSDKASVPAHLKGSAPYSEDELYWLSRIVNAEAQGEINKGKVAVANVVLNRVESNEFPDTVYDVIFDRNYGVQFTPIADGSIYNNPTRASVIAAKRALLGEDVSRQCLYFLNPKTATNSWIPKNRKFYKTIGNHDFYL